MQTIFGFSTVYIWCSFLQRSLWDDLQFASLSEVESNPTPVRKIVIPTMFSTPLQYKQTLVSALRGLYWLMPLFCNLFINLLIYELLMRSRLRFLCCFTEHLNIILFTLSKQYHQAMSKTDTSSLTFPGKLFYVADEIMFLYSVYTSDFQGWLIQSNCWHHWWFIDFSHWICVFWNQILFKLYSK